MGISLQVIFIAAALSLGVFADAAKRGANIVRLNIRLLFAGLVWGIVNLGAAAAGYGLGKWVLTEERGNFHAVFLAGILLIFIGGYMLVKALRGKTFLEHRMEQIDIREDTLLCLRGCFAALIAGMACGLRTSGVVRTIGIIFVLGLGSAVCGYMVGRHYGALFSRLAELIGGGILLAIGIAIQF